MAAAAVGCARPRSAPSETGEGPEIDAMLQRYARRLMSMDNHGIAMMFEPDGMVLNAGEQPIHGRKAIERFLSGFSAYKVLGYTITPLRTVVAGNTATQVGTFWQRVRIPDGKVIEVRGRFDAEWGRDASGAWFLRRMGTGPAE
jgi:uncharacterized protein (TIGR02246 family)